MTLMSAELNVLHKVFFIYLYILYSFQMLTNVQMCTHVIKWQPKPIDDVRQPDDVRLKSQMHGINDYTVF